MIERSDDPGTIAQAVALAVAGVARLAPGAGIEAATYFAGGKTVGVVVREDRVSVHVAVSELPIASIAEQVRDAAQHALGALGAERPVDVVIEDLEIERLPGILSYTASPPSQRGQARAL